MLDLIPLGYSTEGQSVMMVHSESNNNGQEFAKGRGAYAYCKTCPLVHQTFHQLSLGVWLLKSKVRWFPITSPLTFC